MEYSNDIINISFYFYKIYFNDIINILNALLHFIFKKYYKYSFYDYMVYFYIINIKIYYYIS